MERLERWRLWLDYLILVLIAFSCQKLCVCDSLDAEGRALLSFRAGVDVDPYGALSNWGENGVGRCFWFGVECSTDGSAVSLNLKDLCLQGKLTSEIARLNHLKLLILHNNSFSGSVPSELSKLQKLEVLDLGYNNLTGQFPLNLLGIVSLKVVVLRNNRFINDISPEFLELNTLSELQGDGDTSSSNRGSVMRKLENASPRKLLQEIGNNDIPHKHRRHHSQNKASAPSASPKSSTSLSPILSPLKYLSPLISPSPHSHLPVDQPFHELQQPFNSAPTPSLVEGQGNEDSHRPVYVSVGVGMFALCALSSMFFICCRTNKVETVMPWKTGLSGKLQKALVTGVPSLKCSELQAACEDFSNVIDSLSDCTLYKGTLSNGIEIVVTASIIKSEENWSDQCEALFREKISAVSQVNHKNFLSLIGYSHEEEPFTRMMVYEYAPNGTLFEHLHIKEAEPLNWDARLRVAMGIAYCLEHMQQLDPPVSIRNLNSSTIYLTEDYSAKVSDLSFWNEEKDTSTSAQSMGDGELPLSNQDMVYKFGIILLELISGRLPFSKDDGLLVLWASSHLTGKRPLNGIVDQTVESLRENDISPLCDVIRSCVNPKPSERPTLTDVVAQLRQITQLSPDAATPKLSPLWWAELEILS